MAKYRNAENRPSATAASATLEYKRSTDDAWQQATVSDNGDGTFTAAIEPTWSSSTNEMGKTVYEPDYATGVLQVRPTITA